jgi:nucleotide-binding universal stress UspA family protein
MNKIIVPTDFSPTAAAALRYAYFLAEATGFMLEVLHVHDGYGHVESPRVKKGDLEARMAAQRSIDEFIRFNVKVTESVVGEGETSDVTISSREVTGTPTDALVAASRAADTHLIVMGGVGSGTVSTVTPFFGSVARTVADRAECPVLLVPKDYHQPVMRRASIAFDVVSALREISKGFDFLRVTLNPAMRLVHVRDFSEKAEARKEIALMEEVLNTEFPGYPVELDLLNPGVTALQLLEYAQDEDIDLLVLGRRKRSFFKRFFVGSKIGPVLQHGGAPMLVIPISDY